MENKGNDRKYMDGQGNDWKQVEASRIPGNKLGDTSSGRFYGFPAGSAAFPRVLGIR
ncbi:hypothetical protein BDZ91DRAFT_752752, partial [Kalaharituber pfeilii]